MSKKKKKGLVMRGIVASLLMFTSVSANAVVVTLDADNFEPGDILSNQIDGVTINWLAQAGGNDVYAPTFSDVVRQECLHNTCGDRGVLGNSAGRLSVYNSELAFGCERGSRLDCRDGFDAINVALRSETDYFSFEATWNVDRPILFAYSATGAHLFTCYTYIADPSGSCFYQVAEVNGEYNSLLGFRRGEADVSRVLMGINLGAGVIEEISVSVPEPESLSLLGIAMLGMAAIKRRRS